MNTDALITKLADYGADTTGALERFIDDKELYKSCLLMFLRDEGFAALGAALEAKDYKAAFDAAHSLKGVTGNLGVTPLYNAICGIVEELRAKRYDSVSACYENVRSEYARLQAVLEA